MLVVAQKTFPSDQWPKVTELLFDDIELILAAISHGMPINAITISR